MATKNAYIERDRHGRERIVLETTRRGSAIYTKPTTDELLDAAEDREAVLVAENNSLRAKLGAAQKDQWELRNLQAEWQHLCHSHQNCRHLKAQLDAQVKETRRIEDKLGGEKDKTYGLKEKVDMLKEKYEEKCKEVDDLKRIIFERDDIIRLEEIRITDKNRTIIYLKNYLRDHGFRVELHDLTLHPVVALHVRVGGMEATVCIDDGQHTVTIPQSSKVFPRKGDGSSQYLALPIGTTRFYTTYPRSRPDFVVGGKETEPPSVGDKADLLRRGLPRMIMK